ncbi:MAG: STAS domain-containing protein [Eubacterium sp.]|nr:STAS domain-containing protein [Eubacterium sp.]
MDINKIKKGTSLTLEVEGRLETTTAPQLDAAVKEEIEGIDELIFDFSKLDYISSAGLRILLSAQKAMNTRGKMKVTGVNEIVNEIFEVTGFSDIITIE